MDKLELKISENDHKTCIACGKVIDKKEVFGEASDDSKTLNLCRHCVAYGKDALKHRAERCESRARRLYDIAALEEFPSAKDVIEFEEENA